ncbi:nuclear transport factor 2 family protein [Muricauda sp. MAR_2010_75]|jgi:hypothetical protein|uniref:nuclear transport factor 2 family protein n=1 Tax=Allomuricauda sp. MAR_2010_75 TaxID=1250232 RepID=UPI00056C1DD2|nr:nuclear transport factor 2 family protein [Muricauda sp. MAR_2010_75]
MNSKELISDWFRKWETGDFYNLPVTDNFKHTSPFGTINGKKAYLNLVEQNRDKFLGYQFKLHDALYGNNNACVRYTGTQGDFSLEVSEWYYMKGGLIKEIVAYYHIGEIAEDRKLSQ